MTNALRVYVDLPFAPTDYHAEISAQLVALGMPGGTVFYPEDTFVVRVIGSQAVKTFKVKAYLPSVQDAVVWRAANPTWEVEQL